MADDTPTPNGAAKAANDGKGTFTQADVDRLIGERLARQEADLKAKAESESKTLSDRLQALETELVNTKTDALRKSVAAQFGISTKPGEKGQLSDADLFLTGSDEKTLIAQAERLADRESDRKKQGNVAPKEGDTKSSVKGDDQLRDFARDLFNRDK